jgi:adenylate kinase
MSLYLIIMGVQGAGKGTQAGIIEAEYGIPQVSTGDLFRAMKTREDELAQRVQAIMRSGALVPDDLTNEILQDRLEQPDAAQGAILDGYPRNLDQAAFLEDYLQGRGQKLAGVLLLDLDFYTAFKRVIGRVKSPSSGETYNIFYHDNVDWTLIEDPEERFPPAIKATDQTAGETLERRPDDHAFSVIKRIDTFEQTTKPLIKHYEDRGLLMRIDAIQSVEAVSAEIKAAIQQVQAES